jgi:hypothetical protein
VEEERREEASLEPPVVDEALPVESDEVCPPVCWCCCWCCLTFAARGRVVEKQRRGRGRVGGRVQDRSRSGRSKAADETRRDIIPQRGEPAEGRAEIFQVVKTARTGKATVFSDEKRRESKGFELSPIANGLFLSLPSQLPVPESSHRSLRDRFDRITHFFHASSTYYHPLFSTYYEPVSYTTSQKFAIKRPRRTPLQRPISPPFKKHTERDKRNALIVLSAHPVISLIPV